MRQVPRKTSGLVSLENKKHRWVAKHADWNPWCESVYAGVIFGQNNFLTAYNRYADAEDHQGVVIIRWEVASHNELRLIGKKKKKDWEKKNWEKKKKTT